MFVGLITCASLLNFSGMLTQGRTRLWFMEWQEKVEEACQDALFKMKWQTALFCALSPRGAITISHDKNLQYVACPFVLWDNFQLTGTLFTSPLRRVSIPRAVFLLTLTEELSGQQRQHAALPSCTGEHDY